VEYTFPDDENNPYAAPEASLRPDRPTFGTLGRGELGSAPVTGPNPNAEIRIDAISEAWQLFTDQAGTWVLIFLVYWTARYGVVFLLASIPQFFTRPFGRVGGPGFDPSVFILLQVVIQFTTYAVQAFLVGGLFQTAVKQVRGLPIGVGDLFKASDMRTWQSMFVVRLIVGVATFGGAVLLILPGLFFSARLMFAQPLVADGKLSTFEAIGMSWKATRGQWLIGMAFVIVMYFTSVLGVIGLGVGLLVTLPVWPLSIAVLYRDFFLSPTDRMDSPWIYDKPDVLEEL
jgi:hypothetical protein